MTTPPQEPDRHLAAHERLATGTLARWYRACATHPRRVIGTWLVIIPALMVSVALFGGELRDEFSIPGSDTQRATDLIEAEFSSEQGAVLNIVFAAPEGETLDTPEREAAIKELVTKLQSDEFAPHDDKVGIENVSDPYEDDTFSEDGRIGYLQAQFSDVITDKDRDQVVAVEDAARETLEPAGIQVEFNGEAEFPPLEQGVSELIGIMVALFVLLFLFRTLVATVIPIGLALTALLTAFMILFLLAGLTDINTVTPILVSMIGLGVGIDYSLFIITRFRQLLHGGLSPEDAAAEAGASAGRAVLFAGLTVAISVSGLALIGLDFVTKLGIGSALGVLTTVLIANSLLISVLAKLGTRRSVGVEILLYVVTFGLYGWFWAYKRHKYAREQTGSGLGGWPGFIVWVLLRPVAAFLVPHTVGKMYKHAGKETGVSALTGLWLLPFSLLIVPIGLLSSDVASGVKTGAGVWIAAAVVLAIIWFVKVQRAVIAYEVAAGEPTAACAIDRLKVPLIKRVDDSDAGREKTLVAKWGRFVTNHPGPVFTVVLVILLAAGGTSALVRLGAADQGTQPTEQTARRAYDLLAEGFGAGFNAPIPIVIDVNDDPDAPQRIFEGAEALPDVASVGEPQFNDEETVAIVFVTPDSAPQDEATDKLIDHLRSDVVPAATEGGDARAYVSGLNAAFKDIADQIISRMPLFLLYIIGVTFIVLAMAFRSIVVSATAAVTTILSAFVGFGVLTLVVQEGHLLGLTGLDKTGPIETFVPPIAFAILFGLSMDYMVFLMSRIREEHVHGLPTKEAVAHGISAIGRVIIAAALIMGSVFAAFILSADRIPKEFGLLLAVAILTDALLVRMTLVPAFFTLLGEKTWYIPKWLDKLLPNVTIEAPHDGPAPVLTPTPVEAEPEA